MDASKLLEILDYLDVEDHNKPISIDDLYGKIFGSLPEASSKVGGYLSNLKCTLLEGRVCLDKKDRVEMVESNFPLADVKRSRNISKSLVVSI